MNLKRTLSFVQDLLYTRQDISIEDLVIEEIEPEVAAIVEGRLHYWDVSLLKFVEHLMLRGAVSMGFSTRCKLNEGAAYGWGDLDLGMASTKQRRVSATRESAVRSASRRGGRRRPGCWS